MCKISLERDIFSREIVYIAFATVAAAALLFLLNRGLKLRQIISYEKITKNNIYNEIPDYNDKKLHDLLLNKEKILLQIFRQFGYSAIVFGFLFYLLNVVAPLTQQNQRNDPPSITNNIEQGAPPTEYVHTKIDDNNVKTPDQDLTYPVNSGDSPIFVKNVEYTNLPSSKTAAPQAPKQWTTFNPSSIGVVILIPILFGIYYAVIRLLIDNRKHAEDSRKDAKWGRILAVILAALSAIATISVNFVTSRPPQLVIIQPSQLPVINLLSNSPADTAPTVLAAIYFDEGSSEISPKDEKLLERIAKALTDCIDGDLKPMLSVKAFASSSPYGRDGESISGKSNSNNKTLADKRADAVKEKLQNAQSNLEIKKEPWASHAQMTKYSQLIDSLDDGKSHHLKVEEINRVAIISLLDVSIISLLEKGRCSIDTVASDKQLSAPKDP